MTDFFSAQEITDWKEHQQQKRLLHWIGTGSTLLFYLIFFALGLNRYLKAFSEWAADRLYENERIIATANKHPSLRRLAGIPERLFGARQWLVVLLYSLSFVCLLQLALFPCQFYRSFWYETQHGLSNYTPGLWLLDYFKGLVVGTALFGLMVFGIYGLIWRVGRKWWLCLWVGVSIAIFGWVYLVPYRSMMYSRFVPLEEGSMRAGLESLIRGQGLEIENIYVVDASRRTRQVNAYVTGKGTSRRIVLYDTLLEQFTPREITMILAHELVHWKEPEKKSQYLIFSLTVFFTLFLADLVLRWGSRMQFFHYTSFRDVAGLPLLFLTFFLIFLIIRPVNLYRERAHELETDRGSLQIVCDPEAFVGVHTKLARLNRSEVNPHPLTVFLFFSHPPFLERVRTAYSGACHGEGVSP